MKGAGTMWTKLPRYEQRGECASLGCGEPPAVSFEAGNVVSVYCPECARRIERLRARSVESNREIDELEAIFGGIGDSK
jgi:hypothetical protein